MRLGTLPAWPPLLATRGPGARSSAHAHHAMHVLVGLDGDLSFRQGTRGPSKRAPALITAPDVLHAIDAKGRETLLVFIDPDSEHGAILRACVRGVQALDASTRKALLAAGDDPMHIMTDGGAAWTANAVAAIAGTTRPRIHRTHPRVRKLLRVLRALPSDADTSLESLARLVGLSPSRLMHAFTTSIGTPLRPYLAWLRLQRAAAAIVGGASLVTAAHDAGFSDAAHMTRTFRRMFGMTPSSLRPPNRPQSR
jgi:AraC-like DNA-binding protein